MYKGVFSWVKNKNKFLPEVNVSRKQIRILNAHFDM